MLQTPAAHGSLSAAVEAFLPKGSSDNMTPVEGKTGSSRKAGVKARVINGMNVEGVGPGFLLNLPPVSLSPGVAPTESHVSKVDMLLHLFLLCVLAQERNRRRLL